MPEHPLHFHPHKLLPILHRAYAIDALQRAAGEAYSKALEENDISDASKMEERLDDLAQDALAVLTALVETLVKPGGRGQVIIMGATTEDLLKHYREEDNDDSMAVLEELHSRAMGGDKAAQEVLNDHDRDEPDFTPQTGSETR